jgi:ABC-2 type transport system ATP-binding protein
VDSGFSFSSLKYAYKQQSNKVMIEYKEENEKDVFDNLKSCGGYDIQLQKRTFEDAFLKMIGYELDEKGETK